MSHHRVALTFDDGVYGKLEALKAGEDPQEIAF